MATTNITGEEFNSTVRGEGITLVDFWASWCGPCMQFGPVYERASEANPDITFAKVDTDAEQGLARALGISSIPTLMAFRDDVLGLPRGRCAAAQGAGRPHRPGP